MRKNSVYITEINKQTILGHFLFAALLMQAFSNFWRLKLTGFLTCTHIPT